jgi:hypothetical protein
VDVFDKWFEWTYSTSARTHWSFPFRIEGHPFSATSALPHPVQLNWLELKLPFDATAVAPKRRRQSRAVHADLDATIGAYVVPPYG